jgi:glucose/arabinose dehydrogenase
VGEFRAGLQLLTSDLVHPLMLAESPDGTGRLFIVDQIGLVRVLRPDGTLAAQPWLDVRSRMVPLGTGFDERGLLALAFHPRFASNGRLFVHYAAPPRRSGYNNTSVVAEFRVTPGDPNATPTFHREIITEQQPQSNHAGGGIAFGPDGYLYIAWGDGGGQNDVGFGHPGDWYEFNQGGNGQHIYENLLGSVLRIDVDGGVPYAIPADNPFAGGGCANGCDEIWAYGLRNPYQISFDMGGDRSLFISDVGERLWEEINLGVRGGNYGWNVREGPDCFVAADPLTTRSGCPDTDPITGQPLRSPVLQIPNPANPNFSSGSISVIGGFVYRGDRIAGLHGQYVFGSFSNVRGGRAGALYVSSRQPGSNGLWSYRKVNITTSPDGELNEFVLGFGQDLSGEVYVLTADRGTLNGAVGKVFRLVPDLPVVSEVRAASGRAYEAVQGGLAAGTRVYIDRGFTYAGVPAALQGQTYIRTADADRTISFNPGLVTFRVDREATVYVAYNSGAHFPGWLRTRGFVNTGQTLTVDADGQPRSYTLWSRNYPASEEVQLGSNRPGDNTAHLYTVIVTPAPGR